MAKLKCLKDNNLVYPQPHFGAQAGELLSKEKVRKSPVSPRYHGMRPEKYIQILQAERLVTTSQVGNDHLRRGSKALLGLSSGRLERALSLHEDSAEKGRCQDQQTYAHRFGCLLTHGCKYCGY